MHEEFSLVRAAKRRRQMAAARKVVIATLRAWALVDLGVLALAATFEAVGTGTIGLGFLVFIVGGLMVGMALIAGESVRGPKN